MKNFIFTLGICIFTFCLGINACKSKESAYQTDGNESIKIKENLVDSKDGSAYQTNKNTGGILIGDKWKLFEINGVAISSMKPQPATEAFIVFEVNENRVYGNSGCNTFGGTYKLESGGKLQFSDVASTRKMCINNMDVEDQMNKIFQLVDNYTLQDGVLSLKQAGKPLARFVAE